MNFNGKPMTAFFAGYAYDPKEAIEQTAEAVAKQSFAPCIVENASGSAIVLNDSANAPLQGLKLYGKTTQDGTPTPEAPVALESVGKDGNVPVKVMGKNLLPFGYKNAGNTLNGVTTTVNSDGSITWSGTATDNVSVILYNGSVSIFPKEFVVVGLGTYKNISLEVRITDASGAALETAYPSPAKAFNLASYPNATNIRILVKRTNNATVSGTIYPMVVAKGVSYEEYEPYKEPQTLTLPTPNGLLGIGDIRDEIDFARGVYIQRVKTITINGGVAWTKTGSSLYSYAYLTDVLPMKSNNITGMSNRIPQQSSTQLSYDYVCHVNTDSGIQFRDVVTNFGLSELTSDAFNAYLAENPITIVYPIKTPKETPLTAEQMEAYADSALCTYKPATTIVSGAEMAVEYVADTKTYIDNKFAELANAIVNNA